jgi:hypothetical protein
MQTIMTNLVLRGFIIMPGLSDAAAPGGRLYMEISVQWYSTKELGHSLYFFQGAGTFTLLFPSSWDIHFTFSKELGHSLYFFQGARTFTLLFPRSWDIHSSFSKELGHSFYFFQGAGTFTLLFPRSWNIYFAFSKELGHSLYFFHGAGTFTLLFPRSWDIHLTSSKELGHSLYFFQGAGTFNLLLPRSWYIHSLFPRSCTVRKGNRFPVPSQEVNNQTLPGGEKIKLLPGRESLVIDIPAGDGKIVKFFYSVGHFSTTNASPPRRCCRTLCEAGRDLFALL